MDWRRGYSFAFQSHYGLILSTETVGDDQEAEDFQSHYGLILSLSSE